MVRPESDQNNPNESVPLTASECTFKTKQPESIQTQIDLQGKGLTPSLRRAFLFIEDGEWLRADEYLERVLDEEPENAYAYLGKLLVDFKAKSIDDLVQYANALKTNRYYAKALRYSDHDLMVILQSLGFNEKTVPVTESDSSSDKLASGVPSASSLQDNQFVSTAPNQGRPDLPSNEVNHDIGLPPRQELLSTSISEESNSDEPINTSSNQFIKPKKRNKTLFVLFLLLFSGIVGGAIWYFYSHNYAPAEIRDINTMRTIPEVFNIPVDNTYEGIKDELDKHSFEYSTFQRDDCIFGDGSIISVFGMKPDELSFYFENNQLQAVVVSFDKDKYSLQRIISQYERYYGKSGSWDSFNTTWDGASIAIWIEEVDDAISVFYYVYPLLTPKAMSSSEDFLPKIDPLHLVPYIDSQVSSIIGDLSEGKNYKKEINMIEEEDFRDQSYVTYILFFNCDLFGIDKDNVMPKVSANYYTNNIDRVEYEFLIENDSILTDSNLYLESIDQYLTDNCGFELTREWHKSTNPLIFNSISYDQMYSDIRSLQEGDYLVQWDYSQHRITLHFEVRPNYRYSIGTISIA